MTRVAPNFSIVTLGVGDLAGSTTFYDELGWDRKGEPADGIVWFRTSGTWIGLFGYRALAEDAGLHAPDNQPAYRGVTLALNYATEDEVDAAFAAVLAAGGTVVKPPTRAHWGGYSGYFADPDGVLWEIAYAPGFELDDQGRLTMP